jgi:hypothetical protein
MSDLEQKIAAWRRELERALVGEKEKVCELEAHLRDDVATRCRAGAGEDTAFRDAVKQLGVPAEIAREFASLKPGWLPRARWALGVLILWGISVGTMTSLVGSAYFRGKMNLLMFTHVVIVTAGYYALAACAVLGVGALIAGRVRPLSPADRRDIRCTLFRLTVTGGALVFAGVVLGMFWASEHLGHAWQWAPVEVGATMVMLSFSLLLLVQTIVPIPDGHRWTLAMIGGAGVAVGFGAKRFDAMPSLAGWCAVLITIQLVIIVLSRRAGQRRLA